MSVMVLSDSLYSVVLENIGRFQNHPFILPKRTDAEQDILLLRKMNYKSYGARYDEVVETPEFILRDAPKVTSHQLLKYLQCIRYQIELEKLNFDEKQALSRLDGWITLCKDGIIALLPEYINAEWSRVN